MDPRSTQLNRPGRGKTKGTMKMIEIKEKMEIMLTGLKTEIKDGYVYLREYWLDIETQKMMEDIFGASKLENYKVKLCDLEDFLKKIKSGEKEVFDVSRDGIKTKVTFEYLEKLVTTRLTIDALEKYSIPFELI